MSFANRDALVAAVVGWLERSDVSTVAVDWVTLTEARLNRILRVNRMVKRASATITDEFSALPSDFLAPRSMRLAAGDKRLLQYFTPEQMAEFKSASPSGELQAYTVVGSEFEYGPAVPAGSEPVVVLTYFAAIPPLATGESTNWVLARYPDAYLHGCLAEAGAYLNDEELIGRSGRVFASAIEAMQDEDRHSNFAANLTPTPSAPAV